MFGSAETEGVEGSQRSTDELLGFENVRNNGIIETPTSYSMLIEVSPRDWLTLSEQRRSNLYVAYLTYLRGLSFPTQIITMTTSFDADQYYEQFIAAGEALSPSSHANHADVADPADVAADGGAATGYSVDNSLLLEYGRIAHVEWLDSILEIGDVRDRRFFVAVGVNKGEHGTDGDGWVSTLRNVLPGGTSPTEIQDEEPYLDEVWARTHRVASQLPRTQVGTTVLDSRSDVLDVLYLYYRGHESPISFDNAVFTTADDSALTDPATGDPLDLEEAFENADRRDEYDTEDPVERPKAADDPFDGRVAPKYVSTVTNSRLLRWYATNVAPIGNETRTATPTAVFAGMALFVLGALLAVGAFAVFAASGQPDLVSSVPLPTVVVREAAFVLAASSVPSFFFSLTVLLPSSTKVRIVGLLGSALAAGAIYLFSAAYPGAWDVSDMARTMTVLEVYGAGVAALVVAVAFSLRTRRAALAHLPTDTTPATTPGEPKPEDQRTRNRIDDDPDTA